MKYFCTLDQLPAGNSRCFFDFEATVKHFGSVDLSLYRPADIGTVEADRPTEACEKLFGLYNADYRPNGYTGRSMSVGDVVRLWDADDANAACTAWFCDSFGFKKLEV